MLKKRHFTESIDDCIQRHLQHCDELDTIRWKLLTSSDTLTESTKSQLNSIVDGWRVRLRNLETQLQENAVKSNVCQMLTLIRERPQDIAEIKEFPAQVHYRVRLLRTLNHALKRGTNDNKMVEIAQLELVRVLEYALSLLPQIETQCDQMLISCLYLLKFIQTLSSIKNVLRTSSARVVGSLIELLRRLIQIQDAMIDKYCTQAPDHTQNSSSPTECLDTLIQVWQGLCSLDKSQEDQGLGRVSRIAVYLLVSHVEKLFENCNNNSNQSQFVSRERLYFIMSLLETLTLDKRDTDRIVNKYAAYIRQIMEILVDSIMETVLDQDILMWSALESLYTVLDAVSGSGWESLDMVATKLH